MKMNFVKRGQGKPLLLIHGIGGSWRSWEPIIHGLVAQREVVAIDLPGHGQTPALSGENFIYTLADAIVVWLKDQQLEGASGGGFGRNADLR